MSSSKKANSQKRSDISLTSIYQAFRSPNSSTSLACRRDLQSASVKQIDYTLRKLKSYTQQSQWPTHRLVRCLDFIFTQGIRPSSHLQEMVQLPSLLSCLKWVLSAAEVDEESLVGSVKFFCSLLETFSTKLSDSDATTMILSHMKRSNVLKKLLEYTQNSNLSVRTYSVRALAAKVEFFAKDLIVLKAYETLTSSLLNIPSLVDTIDTKPPVTDLLKRRSELEQTIVICRLLESIFKYEELHQPSKERIQFVDSGLFVNLVTVWRQICHREYDTLMNNTPALKVKNGQLLVYSLTNVIQKCTSVSQKAASCVAMEPNRNEWRLYLMILMQRWTRGTCCTMNVAVITPASLKAEKSIMKKLWQISLDTVPVLQHYRNWLDYVDQIICDLTNFFMAYISQPILPEQAAMIGRASTLLHTNICVDVEERGYMLTAAMLNENQDFLILLLESFIQHIQLASSVNTTLVSGRMAWCLKSILTILSKEDQLETSGLRTRLLKLVVFFLHFQDAIDILATSSTSITPYVWGPTIEFAKNGLCTAVSLTNPGKLNPQETSIIYKAKRAFVSLELISKHPRACERLMDCNVLQLVDISLIPPGDIIEKSSSLFTMYALFGRFVAALSRRTAYVRTRLRDECELFSIIMRLLKEAIGHKEIVKGDNASILFGWNQIILSCLLVVNSFQYDESSTSMWLSWDENITRKDRPDLKNEQDVEMKVVEEVSIKDEMEEYNLAVLSAQLEQPLADNKKKSTSILPSVLSVLFPWRRRNADLNTYLKSKDDLRIIMLAAQVLDQLSSIPLCGRQIIADETALSNLSDLMISLTTAAACRENIEEEIDHCAFVVSKEKEGEQENTQQDTTMEEDILDRFGQQMEENYSDTAETSEDNVNLRCAEHLQRSAIRILICHDNIQFTILSDAFTKFFSPMIRHPSSGTSQEYWRGEMCDNLYKKKLDDFEKLYTFTETSGDYAIKLYEFTAIAVGYSAIGAVTDDEWNSTLGLMLLERGIVGTRKIFGVFCQMLVFELEYEEEEVYEDLDKKESVKNSILTLITPLRRNASAQVIEALALEWEVTWKVETDSIRDVLFMPDRIELDSPGEIVHFSTDDSPTLLSGNRQLLRARSPIFEAMLGSHYAEEANLETSTAIPLHDITFQSLELFVSVIHQLNNDATDVLDSTITSWSEIIGLLQISDRFGSKVVRNRCEHWVLNRVKHLNTISKEERMIYLDGLLRLYRQCRDPIEIDGGINSDTWPFATLVRESLKALVQFLSESCLTEEFTNMINDKDVEELDAFCDGIACLIKK